jgi:glycosyltransferase involved in cell wall biosynthesis
MKISIIMPVYNEAGTLKSIIAKVLSASFPDRVERELIIVNDGSTDLTTSILKSYRSSKDIQIFHLKKNVGKSAALQVGIKHAQGDLILFQDADLEYDPIHYSQLLEPVLTHRSNIVFGSRFMGGARKMEFLNCVANRLSTITVNQLFKTRLSDVNTCHKLIQSSLLKRLHIKSNRFGCDAEITAKLLRQGHQIVEVPINYFARSKREGKKLTWIEAIKMYLCFIRFRFAISHV